MKLHQRIFATTTLLLKGIIFEMHLTTLEDAYTSNHSKEKQIKLGGGHNWGACPTRKRSQVVIEPDDIDNIISKWLKLDELREEEANNKRIYLVSFTHQSLQIHKFVFNQKVDSLAEGTYNLYEMQTDLGVRSLKIKDDGSLPSGGFYKIDEAIAHFKERLTKLL
jgi:hypothetical protein